MTTFQQSDVSTRLKEFEDAAARGDADAMYDLAELLRLGENGVPKDLARAAKFYRQAADLGNEYAMYNLGHMLEKGAHGVRKDVLEAAKLYRRAADLGNEYAMYNLGYMLEKGVDRLRKDVPEAAKLYRQAADLGNEFAMYNLGYLLEKGVGGLRKDVPEAAKLYRQAADLGNEFAMYNLGYLLEKGVDGVRRDVRSAAKLYRQAADLGNPYAKENLARLRESDAMQVDSMLNGRAANGDETEMTRLMANLNVSNKRADKNSGEAQATSLQVRSNLSTAQVKPRKYDVFISHAGPHKLEIAKPIYDALERENVHSFLDMQGLQIDDCSAPEAMERAMAEAMIGIFVLSPEFAVREWTMKELRCFLKRDEQCQADGRPRPVLLPIFFRLSIPECRRAETEVYGENSPYGEMVRGSEFFKARRQAECPTAAAVAALRNLTAYSGIEISRIGGGADLSSAEVAFETVRRVAGFMESRR